MVLGSPGGPMIITAVFNTIVNVIDHKMSLKNAIFAPRIHHQWLPDSVRFEQGMMPSIVSAELRKLGHDVNYFNVGMGRVSAIIKDQKTGKLTGVTDSRDKGVPHGY